MADIRIANKPVRNALGVPVPFHGQDVFCVTATVTLAQLNAGFTFLAAATDVVYVPLWYVMIPTGALAASTDIRLSDTAGTPVDIATIATAQVTNGAVLTPTGTVTIGAGFGVPLTANQGVQLRKTGSTGTTMTSIFVMFTYKLKQTEPIA